MSNESPSVWTRIRAALDPIARRYNLYTAYRVSQDEFVGTWTGTVDEFRERLGDAGYVPQYLSAAKSHPESERPWDADEDLHDLSYRHVPDRHPGAVENTGLEAWRPVDCQYHVHLIRGDVFSHYELRPDFFRPTPLAVERLAEHYRPTYDGGGRPRATWTYLRGVTDLELIDG